MRIANEAWKLNEKLTQVKELVMRLLYDFLASNPEHKQPTAKGNITLISLDDKIKVSVKARTIYEANEKVNQAKELIQDLVHEWQQKSHPALGAIAGLTAKMNSNEKLTYGDILALKRLNIKDAKWQEAMDMLDNAFIASGTKKIIYVYWRAFTDAEWIEIPLQWSRV